MTHGPSEHLEAVQMSAFRMRSRKWRAARDSWHLGRTKLGLGLIAIVMFVALAGPLIAPYSHTEFIGDPFTEPSSTSLLGTDYLGRDVLSRVLHGGYLLVWMSVAGALIGVGSGAALGLLAGYTGGWLDSLVMRVLDAVLAFPYIVLVLLFVSLLGPRLGLIVLLVAAAWIPSVARVTRGMTMTLARLEFVEAVEALGLPRRHIVFREILPNVSSPLMVELGLRLTWSVALIAAISFLGLGIQAPQADWGLMISENQGGLAIQPLSVIAPALCIMMFTIGTNLATDGFGRAVAGVEIGAVRT